MNIMPKPTQETLKEFLSYDPNTGELTWIKKPSKKTVLNSRAGGSSVEGYRSFTFKGKKYPEHHIVWCWVYGFYPEHQLDHINQVRDDNRIINLREVTKSENARNRARGESQLDEAGIWYCQRRQRYVAEITLNGKKVYQKTFIDIDQAIEERRAKAIELGFHENHGKSNNLKERKFYV